MALRDLEDARAKERFKTVIIDTVSICWELCEKFICQQNGVQKISDIPWGAGYTACKKEFETSIRRITQLGYGVVLIAHSASRVEKTADGSDIEIISPDLPKRASEVCNGIVDIIGYIGRDIEDAIIMGKIKREDIPESISNVLGTTNKEIVNTIILDIINNSLDKPYIELSRDVYKALFELKEFNYKYIYSVAMSKEDQEYYREGMNKIYDRYLKDVEGNNTDSIIYKAFLNGQSEEYLKNTNNKRKVIDFIAGMTDDFFIKEIA